MDIARPLVTSGAQQALKLILGGAPGGAAWASVGSAVLAALLQGQDETLAALARIEEKLDALLIDQYRNPFRSGLRMLEQAQLAWNLTIARGPETVTDPKGWYTAPFSDSRTRIFPLTARPGTSL